MTTTTYTNELSRSAKKAGCCPMCATVRTVETTGETIWIVCPNKACGDRVEAQTK